MWEDRGVHGVVLKLMSEQLGGNEWIGFALIGAKV
jgi:hypothetical protein